MSMVTLHHSHSRSSSVTGRARRTTKSISSNQQVHSLHLLPICKLACLVTVTPMSQKTRYSYTFLYGRRYTFGLFLVYQTPEPCNFASWSISFDCTNLVSLIYIFACLTVERTTYCPYQFGGVVDIQFCLLEN